MDMEFSSLQELYNRIKPALNTKRREMHRIGFNYIKEEDIWNYLKEVKWKTDSNLSLSDMVSDILNTDEVVIDNYLKSKLNLKKRHTYFED